MKLPPSKKSAQGKTRMAQSSIALVLFALLILGSISDSKAVLTEVYRQSGVGSIDQAFEHWEYDNGVNPTAPGWLRTNYNLPRIRTSASDPAVFADSVLPQVERAVGQIKSDNPNGLFIPTIFSGTPGVANSGSQSPGVIRAFTSDPISNAVLVSTTGTPPPNFSNGTPFTLNFEYKRTNGVVSFTLSQGNTNLPSGSRTWTSPNLAGQPSYYDEINSIELRIRSTSTNSLSISNLKFNDEITTNQTISPVSAAGGNITVALFPGATGNFSLTGSYDYSGTGSWNSQIKGLALAPEPTTVGLVGLSAAGFFLPRSRRRRA